MRNKQETGCAEHRRRPAQPPAENTPADCISQAFDIPHTPVSVYVSSCAFPSRVPVADIISPPGAYASI